MTTSFGRREREERKVVRTSGQVGDCQLGSCRATCEASSASFYSDLLKLILKDASCLTPFVLRARPFVVPQVLLAAITHNDYVALLLGFSLVMIQLTAQLTNSAGKTLKQRGVESPLYAYLKFSPLSSDYKSLYLAASSLFVSQSCHNFWLWNLCAFLSPVCLSLSLSLLSVGHSSCAAFNSSWTYERQEIIRAQEVV